MEIATNASWGSRNTFLRGQALIEYVLLIGIVGLVIVFAGPAVAGAIQNQFGLVANTVNGGGEESGGFTGPKADPVNGKVFAVRSEDDSSLRFYKRDSIPTAGEMFNGRTATEVWEEGKQFKLSLMAMCNRPNIKVVVVEDNGIKPTNMQGFLGGNNSVESVDLKKFDFSNCSDFQGAFSYTSNLKKIDLSGLNFSSATNLASMFANSKIEEVKFSSCLSNNPVNMSCLFNYCQNLKSVDFNGWKACPSTFSNAFSNCPKLVSVSGLSNFDTSSLISCKSMFDGCTSLSTVGNLSAWDVSNVTDMSGMFWNCKSLSTIGDLSGWNMLNVTTTSSMFDGCTSLSTVGDLSSWNVSKINNAETMFYECRSLENIGDIANWNVKNLSNMENMFSGSKINPPSWFKGAYYKG